jgi:hypothetical protein
MFDRPGATPDHSPSFRRGGPAAIFGFEVKDPRGAAAACFVEHRDLGDMGWVLVGSVSMVAPERAALRLGGLKEELRIRSSGDATEVHVLPPRWLPD